MRVFQTPQSSDWEISWGKRCSKSNIKKFMAVLAKTSAAKAKKRDKREDRAANSMMQMFMAMQNYLHS